MKANLKNESNGNNRDIKVGFSWTMLFFGIFVPLFRGDWKWLFISIGLAAITFGLSWLVLPFIYNKVYINNLLRDGFKPSNEVSEKLLASKGYTW